jgi:hypothetical protein
MTKFEGGSIYKVLATIIFVNYPKSFFADYISVFLFLTLYTASSMSLAPKARVLSGYRRLFRARKNLFAGDHRAMEESRLAIKAEFVKNKAVPTVGDHFEGLLTMVDEAEDMLRHHIVRGELNQETGNYRT